MEERTPETPNQAANSVPVRHHNRSLKHRIIVWTGVLLVFAALFALVLTHEDTAVAQTGSRRALMAGTVSVAPALARKGDIGVYQEAIGTVTPVYTSSITSQVTGLVMAVHYREGQLVDKGEPLVDIDPRPFQATLAQHQGTLDKDRQTLAQARMDLQRYRAALAQNAIARQVVEDQEKIVLQTEGTVRADEGQVEYDKVQLAYCHITAPFAGRVGLRLVDPGNVVQANAASPLVVLTQQQPITVIFSVPEDALGEIQAQLHRQRRLVVDAYNRTAMNRIARGTLASIDNQIDTTTGTVKLRAIFDNKDGALFPNQFVNTRLLVETLHGVTLIPTSAIQHNGQISFVYVLENGAARVANVRPGVTSDNLTEVTGIDPGTTVANSSFEKLRPNAKVVIARQKPPGGPGGGGNTSADGGDTAP